MSADALSIVLPEAQDVLRDASASSWLKGALQGALQRDPVDALNDALLLASILETRLRTALDLGAS